MQAALSPAPARSRRCCRRAAHLSRCAAVGMLFCNNSLSAYSAADELCVVEPSCRRDALVGRCRSPSVPDKSGLAEVKHTQEGRFKTLFAAAPSRNDF